MGRLGWTPDVTMAADPQMVLLAIEGRDDFEYDFRAWLYSAQGAKVPPRPRRGAPKPKVTWKQFRAFVQSHNAALARAEKTGVKRGAYA